VSGTDVLLNVATAARLFHASDGTGFADLLIDGHRETWPLRSNRFQAWLCQHYSERIWDAPSPAALNAALNVLEAQAQFDGAQCKVSLRLAELDADPMAADRIVGPPTAALLVSEAGYSISVGAACALAAPGLECARVPQ
jgi:hypothetical protein